MKSECILYCKKTATIHCKINIHGSIIFITFFLLLLFILV